MPTFAVKVVQLVPFVTCVHMQAPSEPEARARAMRVAEAGDNPAFEYDEGRQGRLTTPRA